MSTRKDTQKDPLSKYYNHDQTELSLDFSRIPGRDFEGVLMQLVKIGRNQLKSLIISLDLYRENHPDEFPSRSAAAPRLQTSGDPILLQKSAYRSDAKALKAIIIALKHILQKTESLTSIKFQSIFFEEHDLKKLTNLLRNCGTLKSITFEYVPLYDNGFSVVFPCAKKEGIESFACISCGITDNSIINIKNLLNFHYSEQGKANFDDTLRGRSEYMKRCISELILKGNSLSSRALLEIGELIADIPIALLDLSNNQEIDERMAANIRKNAPHVELLVNSVKNGVQKIPKSPVASKITSPKRTEPTIQCRSIEPEQQRFCKVSDDIDVPILSFGTLPPQGKDDEVWISEDLKVVGPRAKEFAQYLHDLQTSLLKLQQQHQQEKIDKEYLMNHKRVNKPKRKPSNAKKSLK